MLILTADNTVKNTDTMNIGDTIHHGILSFEMNTEPDFFFPVIEFLEEFAAASITLKIGNYQIVMPLHWSVLCTDMEYIQTIPLHEVGGKQFPVFCLNPIDGYSPEFLRLRTGAIFPNSTWTAPQLKDKDLLTIPLSSSDSTNNKGPLCAFFSASKFEVYKTIGDIW